MTTIIQHTKNTLQGLTRDFHDRQNFSQTLTTKWSDESEEELVNHSNSFVYIQFPNNPPWMSDRLANYSTSLLMSRLSEIPWCTWLRATAVSTDTVHYRQYSSMTVKKWRGPCPVEPPHWHTDRKWEGQDPRTPTGSPPLTVTLALGLTQYYVHPCDYDTE